MRGKSGETGNQEKGVCKAGKFGKQQIRTSSMTVATAPMARGGGTRRQSAGF